MFTWTRFEVGAAVALALLLAGVGMWYGHSFAQGNEGVVVVEAVPKDDAKARASTTEEPSSSAKTPQAEDGSETTQTPCSEEETSVLEEDEGADVRININLALSSELQRLPGIGPALAERIIRYRDQWGPFDKVEDIMEVSGIGPAKFASMQSMLKVR